MDVFINVIRCPTPLCHCPTCSGNPVITPSYKPFDSGGLYLWITRTNRVMTFSRRVMTFSRRVMTFSL
jgi:hypothetical protein